MPYPPPSKLFPFVFDVLFHFHPFWEDWYLLRRAMAGSGSILVPSFGWVCVCVCVCVGGWVWVCVGGCLCGCLCGCVRERETDRQTESSSAVFRKLFQGGMRAQGPQSPHRQVLGQHQLSANAPLTCCATLNNLSPSLNLCKMRNKANLTLFRLVLEEH